MGNTRFTFKQGFTIVELLIVIVVIAVLASITVVSYNGIQTRASEAVLKSELSSASKQLEVTRSTSSSYPGDLDAMRMNEDIEFTYSYDAGADSYCLSGTSSNTAVPTYYVTNNELTPREGSCPEVADVWTVSAPAISPVTELGCLSSCTRTILVAPSNYSYTDGTVTSLDGGSSKLFSVGYACYTASCGVLTYTITAEAPLEIADDLSTNWSSTLTRGSGSLGSGSNASVFYQVRVPADAPQGTRKITISAASNTVGATRIFTNTEVIFVK